MNKILFEVDKELSEEDKQLYFSFLFDKNIKETTFKRNRRKTIVLFVASIGMLFVALYRTLQSEFKLIEWIPSILILLLLASQIYFQRKDERMYETFMSRYTNQPVRMRYIVYQQMVEIFIGKESVIFTYKDICNCKQSKRGLLIEFSNQDKKRVGIIMNAKWDYFQLLVDILDKEQIQIKQYVLLDR